MASELLYLVIKGAAIALDRGAGREIWRTKLPGSEFVNLVVDRGELYASSRGEIFRLSTINNRAKVPFRSKSI